VLIDAGTGVGDLSLAELSLIDYIFIRTRTSTTWPRFVPRRHGGRHADQAAHGLCPARHDRDHAQPSFQLGDLADFSEIPSPSAISALRGDRSRKKRFPCRTRITPIPGAHRAGGRLPPRQRKRELVFTGDTGPNDALWRS